MCGRYALVLRPRALRRRIREYGLPVAEPSAGSSGSAEGRSSSHTNTNSTGIDRHETTKSKAAESPLDQNPAFSDDGEEEDDTDKTRQSYNIAPGYIEPVYRAVIPGSDDHVHKASEQAPKQDAAKSNEVTYVVQGMKWGLVPSWTKRNPDYSTRLRTINCRDDSLLTDSGMWTSMKKKKRCIILAEGFFEWQKKGKDKVPHYIKRQDGHLMFMAGLWDCVRLPDPSTGQETKSYTYTIITVPASSQMQFLHDRMPAILINPEEILAWLDPTLTKWTSELQALLRPFSGVLEIYPVPKEVGKVGNNDRRFVLPRDSKENKSNIKNWFGNSTVKKKDNSSNNILVKDEDFEVKVKRLEEFRPEDNEMVSTPTRTGSSTRKRGHTEVSPDDGQDEPHAKEQKPSSPRH